MMAARAACSLGKGMGEAGGAGRGQRRTCSVGARRVVACARWSPAQAGLYVPLELDRQEHRREGIRERERGPTDFGRLARTKSSTIV